MATGLAKHFPWIVENRETWHFPSDPDYMVRNNVKAQAIPRCLELVLKCHTFLAVQFTLPNISFRFHFTFPDYSPSEPLRG